MFLQRRLAKHGVAVCACLVAPIVYSEFVTVSLSHRCVLLDLLGLSCSLLDWLSCFGFLLTIDQVHHWFYSVGWFCDENVYPDGHGGWTEGDHRGSLFASRMLRILFCHRGFMACSCVLYIRDFSDVFFTSWGLINKLSNCPWPIFAKQKSCFLCVRACRPRQISVRWWLCSTQDCGVLIQLLFPLPLGSGSYSDFR